MKVEDGTDAWVSQGNSLELIIRCNQHDFVRLARALAASGHFSIGAGLGHLLRGLLRVLLIGWGEVVDGILHHVSRVYGFLQAAGDALHWGDVFCMNTNGQDTVMLQLEILQQRYRFCASEYK